MVRPLIILIGMRCLIDVVIHFFFESLFRRTESASALIGDNSLDNDDDNDDDVGRSDTKEANLVLPGNDATQHRWKKCAALKESETDITTQEEFYKFDFQVMSNQNSTKQFQFDLYVFATMLSFPLNFI